MADEKVYVVGRFRTPAGQIQLEDGTTHAVLHVRSRIYHALKNAKGAEYIPALEAATRELVPTMTDEQAGELTNEDMNDIVAIGGLGVEAVEKLHPNVPSPAGSTPPG